MINIRDTDKVLKLVGVVFGLVALVVFASALTAKSFQLEPEQVLGKKVDKKSETGCTTIHDGVLKNSIGELLQVGYDDWGYNYQAHMFNGMYCDSYRDAEWCQPYKDVNLMMKWNDAWLSNKDCVNDDGLLDRHAGFDSYIGSGAWLTNHQSETYFDDNDEEQHWSYFVKIVAAPADATVVNGNWMSADDTEIGPVIWGSFAIVQQVYNDTATGEHGVEYKSPAGPGFGQYKPDKVVGE